MTPSPHGEIIERLPDGLVLRRSRPEDTDALVDFNAQVHGGPEGPSEFVRDWAYDLLTRPHPTFGKGGFMVVEDPATGRIVSSLNLIPQEWSYAGVRFGVGRVELVGTLPEYRRRGLVRRQMDAVHAWSAANGDLAQIITGIANFYRQFGYDQGLYMGGARTASPRNVPSLPEGEAEPFRLRPATIEDAPFLAAAEEQARGRWLLTCPRDETLWRHDIAGWSENSRLRRYIGIIERAPVPSGSDVLSSDSGESSNAGTNEHEPGQRVGYVVAHGRFEGGWLTTYAYEVLPGLPGVSWLTVTPSVLRHLKSVGDAYVRDHPDKSFERLEFQLGLDHPAYHAAPWRLRDVERQFVNYVRFPDLAAFVRRIAPVLEARLDSSVAAGHTGRLRLSFYRDGLSLTFQDGRLTEVAACPHSASTEEHGPIGATFPDLTFAQLLLGGRSIDELEHSFGDCRVRREEARVLLGVLFPKHPSFLWPIR